MQVYWVLIGGLIKAAVQKLGRAEGLNRSIIAWQYVIMRFNHQMSNRDSSLGALLEAIGDIHGNLKNPHMRNLITARCNAPRYGTASVPILETSLKPLGILRCRFSYQSLILEVHLATQMVVTIRGIGERIRIEYPWMWLGRPIIHLSKQIG